MRIFTVIILCMIISCRITAQSYHFSQFYSTPLLTNPANTGFIDGTYRVASNFKTQGAIGGGGYFTGYLSAEFALLRDKLPEGNKAGVGIYIMNDQSLNRALQTNSVGFSTAYNIVLDEDGYYSLGAGLQGTYHERTLDYSKLSVENQFRVDGTQDRSILIDGVPANYRKQKYFDANAGIMYHANLENSSFFAGVAIYNSIKHKENIQSEEFKMPTRYTLQAGGRIDVSAKGSICFSVINLIQSKANELTGGMAYTALLTEDRSKEMSVGLWYRYKDALIPYVGYQLNGWQIGFSYDYTVSSQKTASQLRNSYELTLLFSAPDRRGLIRGPWY